MNDLLLVGAGGHCRSCIDVIEAEGKLRIVGIVAPHATERVLGYPVLGEDDDLPALVCKFRRAFIAVGQIRSPDVRIRLFENLRMLSAELPSITSPHSYVSSRASLDAGTIVMHGAVINVGVSIGENTIINSLSLLEHDVTVSSHCHISTGVRLNGGVCVDMGSFIGSGAVVHQGVRIGKRCIVGAGTNLRHDLSDGSRYFGDL